MGAAAKKKSKPKAKKKPGLTAANVDRHDLYQRAVQDPEFEVEFLQRIYGEMRDGAIAHHFREDFCGTALTAVKWIDQGPEFTAEGFDLDPDVLEWGRSHLIAPNPDATKRLRLFLEDVRSTKGKASDIRCAHNFSYQVFKKRTELLEYFRAVHRGLAPHGVFCLDMFGGSEAIEAVEEERWVDDGAFKYVWDQDEYLPGTADLRCYIHFRFNDGSELRRAFTYEWRLWTMPEIKELLAEAGFSRVISYFEEYDDEGDGTGVFSVNEHGDACESWLAYVVAGK
jgi:SAM-dependent methyltransferase